MKLLNHTLAYLSVAFFVVIGIWAAVFYINMLDEIYDSLDDGLDNTKTLIIRRAQKEVLPEDTSTFMESHYAIREIPAERAMLYRDVYTDSTMYMVNEDDFEPVRILTTAFRAANDRYYELKIFTSMVEEDDLIEDLLYALVSLYLLLLISCLLINNFLLKRIWKPFYKTLESLRNFQVESATRFKEEKTPVAEFILLNKSIKELLDRTVNSFQSQKQFIENASHELQTPLAISISKLELLAEKESMNESELMEISSVIQSLERLTRLNKTLLLLSRIENRQFPEVIDVNFNELTDRIVAEYSDLAMHRTIEIKVVHSSSLVRRMNPELASIMITNLLKNAIVHNVEGGTVTLIISSDSVSIENTGSAHSLDQSKIFNRFYKNSESGSSTGLGLSIVKSIADHYNFDVRYEFNGRHQFSIKMPLS